MTASRRSGAQPLSERYPVIARIPSEAYRRILAWCAAHDVEHGATADHIYDAPSGGAINVWSQPWDTWEHRRASQLHGTYMQEREDGLHQGEVFEAHITALSEGRQPRGLADTTGLSGSEEILPSKMCLVVWWAGCEPDEHPGMDDEYAPWTAAQAKEHFAALYQHVIGTPPPGATRS